MSEDGKEILEIIGWLILVFIMAVMLNLMGRVEGHKRGVEIMQKEAISLNKATYNPTNRAFEWKK